MQNTQIRRSPASIAGDVIIYGVGLLVILITLVPLIHVLAMSVSDPLLVSKQEIYLIPRGINFDAYGMVMENRSFWNSYGNTLWIVFFGTLVNVALTVTMAYPLSRRDFFLRRPLMLLVTFTMFFSGGLVPTFITVNKVGLYNSRWAVILPFAISTYNLIVCRTFFESIPESLAEAARIDGANDIQILFKIILPLSHAIIAVLVLFYAVGHWNSYFPAMLYLSKSDLQPVQVYLMRVLIQDYERLPMREAQVFPER